MKFNISQRELTCMTTLNYYVSLAFIYTCYFNALIYTNKAKIKLNSFSSSCSVFLLLYSYSVAKIKSICLYKSSIFLHFFREKFEKSKKS